ncbi:MAG TPA: Gfo/Idh/MocA family oxidoreductase [Polyangia bacterium]|nr:Gfo/Idh/MocA family oxidoreductase [Polyangia bacterium]
MDPAEPIRTAVIGAGHWGPNLIRNFDNPPASVVKMVVDRDGARLRQVRARFPSAAVSEDATDAFADPAVDAVVVATPTSSHYGLVKAALEAGKHVLVEKPITTHSGEAEELVALAARRERVLVVGHVFLFNLAVQRVRAYLTAGELGRLYYVSMVRTNLGPIRVDVNAAWDLMSHDISIVNYWLGAEPETASAVGGTWINRGREDAVFATLRYPNEVLVNVHASWLNPRKSREVTVAGDKRMLTFDDMNILEPLRLYDKQVSDQPTRPEVVDTFASFRASIRDGDITIPKVSTGEPLRNECEHFLDCIRTGKRPLAGGAEGSAVVRALEAIDRSMRDHGREQAVRRGA